MEIMDINSLVSTDGLKELKCSKCQNYLSYFPIYISTDKLNICGRCSQPKEDNYFRNEVYEAICENISFPCRYINEGCVEKVLAKKMPAHEKSCTFRIVKCPIAEFTQCDWKGSHPNLLQHCHDKHSDIILKNSKFQLKLSESLKCENLVQCKEELVMFSRHFDSTNKVLNYSVHQLEGSPSVGMNIYKIIFEHEGRNLSIDDYLCRFDQKSMTEICLEVLKDPYEYDDVVNGTIDFEDTSPENTSHFSKIVNKELLPQLQCSVCHDYLMPPLALYAESKTKCSQCRAKDTGYSHSTPIPNIKLDKVADLLSYPCKYKKNGCNFESKPSQMKIHQNDCPCENQVCPLNEFVKCEWSGLNKDVVSHVQNGHSQTILGTNVISERLPKFHGYYSSTKPAYSEFTKCYIVKLNDCLFRLNFCYKKERFCWAAHKIGTGYYQNRFRFEIEVIDKNKTNRKLLVRQVCAQVLTKKDEVFTNAEEYCYFQTDQIESLLCQDTITFKVHFVK